MAKTLYRLTFSSGATTVTGSNFLLEGPLDSADRPILRVLVDCGLVQGEKLADEINWEPFAYDPASIDFLFVTHAHIDHLGRIPKLVKDGFKGKIIATPPTCALARPMLEDTAAILSHDSDHGLDEIYTPAILDRALAGWTGVEYEKPFELVPGLSATFHNAGHILGSAYISFTIGDKKLVFSGDLGNSPSPILPDTTPLTDADYLLVESVYGDRNHESRDERRDLLKKVVLDNYKNAGTLVIPAFSLERTQELIFELNELVEHGHIPKMPVYLDSPLAIAVTDIYRRYADYFNEEIQRHLAAGDDPFLFSGLVETLDASESKRILKAADPKIIIAGSGMSSGGRVIHHEKNYLPDPKNTLLLIGYQAVGTMGRQIESGASSVTINHEKVPVRAHISKITGYSGHKDSDALVDFVAGAAGSLKKVYTVLGEPKSTLYLAQRLRNELGIKAEAPEPETSVIIEG